MGVFRIMEWAPGARPLGDECTVAEPTSLQAQMSQQEDRVDLALGAAPSLMGPGSLPGMRRRAWS
jgi:hypothetical protein